MPYTPHTEPHAALILAELLAAYDLTDCDDPLVIEALAYVAAARREHPAAGVPEVEVCEGVE